MSGLFGASKQQTATQPTAAQGVNIQTSVLGRAIPLVYGTTRIAGNLMLYGNFSSITVATTTQSGGGGGGKGGMFSGGTQPSSSTTYNYFASFAFALCEGPIVGIVKAWKDKDIVSLATLGFTLFTGTYPQTAWATTVTWKVTDQNNVTTTGTSTPLGYNGIAYVAATKYALGTNATTPNHTFEVEGVYSNSVSGKLDADPSLVLADMLTNAHYGAGFPSSLLGDLTTWQNYCLASGLLISPAYTSQTAASSMLDEIFLATNSEGVWSSGLMTVVPRGDQTLTGNGKTYTAPSVPLFDLTDDDFMASPQGAGSGSTSGPVVMMRKRPSDKINSVKIEYLDRSNNYNPAICYANDQALIDTYGLRTNGSKQLHLFCDATAANLSANLQMRREQICNTYYFDLDQRYIVLDPMDIVTITDSNLGLSRQWVRIIEITENDDGSLSFIAEEYLAGTGAAPAYTFAQASGYLQNRASAPGLMADPIFIEPPFALATGLEVWVAASAPISANWGGADVYLSTDGLNYQLIGRVNGSARSGYLTATLPTFTRPVSGLPIDQTDTLSVDLTTSNGELTTTSFDQANNLASLCWVGGEFLSYATATLTATNKYNLTYLVRGAYESNISAHTAGTAFVRVDSGLFKIPYTSDRIGQTISVKFLSFNANGGGQLTLATAPAYSYTVLGIAMSYPLDDVTNVSAGFIGNISSIDWSEITDFRPFVYEIRKGATWDSGQLLARQAHPPFKTFGDGTYWIAAYSQPIPNLNVYSPNPVSIVIGGANVTANIVATRVEDPGWTGTLSGDVVKIGAAIQTTGTTGGTYTIPVGDRILITSAFACGVIIDWTSGAAPLNDCVICYWQPAGVTVGSNTITDIQVFSGNAQLQGNTTVTGISNTTNMGAGDWITGVGISSGCQVLSVLSTASIMMTIAATTGSTSSPSTQTLTFNPNLNVGSVIDSSNFSTGTKILSIPTLSSIVVSTTAIGSSTTANVTVSIDWLSVSDFFGSQAAQFANVYPEIRMSQDGGSNWSAWQRYVSGYYLGNGFDARMQIGSDNIDAIGILETFTFKVDVPDRFDHYNSFAVSSLGSTITFRPDGKSSAAFNGGPQGTTVSQPSLVGAVINGNPADSIAFTSISLSGAIATCYTSTGGAVARTANIIAKGY